MLLFQLILKVPFEVDQCRIIVKVLMHIESKIIHGIVIESSPCCCSLIMRFIHQTKHNIRIKILFTYLVEEIWFQAQTQHGLTIDCFDSEKKYICHYSYFYFSLFEIRVNEKETRSLVIFVGTTAIASGLSVL